MTVPSNETALQKEQRLFRELSTRLRDTLLSRLLDLISGLTDSGWLRTVATVTIFSPWV